mgnify:CR=1 FL=1
MLHDDSLVNKITKATISDSRANEIMVPLNSPSPDAESLDLNQFTTRDELLHRNHLLYVPDGLCHTCHGDPLAGHFGVTKTMELLSRGFWWPQPWKFVKEFITTLS